MDHVCRACGNRRVPGHYLCGNCWGSLSATVRRQLTRRDAQTIRRLRQLYDAVHAGVPLPDICITEEAQ